MLFQHMLNMGISMFEIALGWWGTEKRLTHCASIKGLERIQQAQKDGKGVLLLATHMTCMETAGRIFSLHHSLYVTFKPPENDLYRYFMYSAREKAYGKEHLIKGNSREILSALKNGKIVWFAPDQTLNKKSSVFVDFFGVKAATLTNTSRLIKASNSVLLPYSYYRDTTTNKYHLEILPSPDSFPSESPEQDALTINHIHEEIIRQAPAQYLWTHRRFRHNPPGESRKMYK